MTDQQAEKIEHLSDLNRRVCDANAKLAREVTRLQTENSALRAELCDALVAVKAVQLKAKVVAEQAAERKPAKRKAAKAKTDTRPFVMVDGQKIRVGDYVSVEWEESAVDRDTPRSRVTHIDCSDDEQPICYGDFYWPVVGRDKITLLKPKRKGVGRG